MPWPWSEEVLDRLAGPAASPTPAPASGPVNSYLGAEPNTAFAIRFANSRRGTETTRVDSHESNGPGFDSLDEVNGCHNYFSNILKKFTKKVKSNMPTMPSVSNLLNMLNTMNMTNRMEQESFLSTEAISFPQVGTSDMTQLSEYVEQPSHKPEVQCSCRYVVGKLVVLNLETIEELPEPDEKH